MEKGNDFSLHFKAYLNSLAYESKYIYFLSFEYYFNNKFKLKSDRLQTLRGSCDKIVHTKMHVSLTGPLYGVHV